MAKAKTGTVPAATNSKAVVKAGELDELSQLVMTNAALEASHRDVGGRQYSYLKLVGNTANDPMLNPKKPEYIKGAQERGWVIPSRKLNLGKEVKLTVLGMFKVYEDTVAGEQTEEMKKRKQDPMRKVVGYWMPVDAENIPVEGMFDRPYTDRSGVGHVLRPVHWVHVYLHDNPEIDDALLTFRSTGNSVYKQLQKLIQGAAITSTELRLVMTHQEIASKTYDKDFLYPDFEIDGRNYDVSPEGQVKTRKDGMDKDVLVAVVKAANALQESYVTYKMVSKIQNIASKVAGFIPPSVPAQDTATVAESDSDGPARF